MSAGGGWGEGIVPSYDAIAEEYAHTYFDELDGKPFDREVLDRYAASVRGRGRVCDLGCGPGQIARHLAARGVEAFGIDASAAMVTTARRLNPTLDFHQGNFYALDLADGSLAGIAAFYSLIHCERPALPRAVRELHRVLAPGGRLLMAVHADLRALHPAVTQARARACTCLRKSIGRAMSLKGSRVPPVPTTVMVP